jgi:aminoglycoside phosphotransferase (APT) family kinase protein
MAITSTLSHENVCQGLQGYLADRLQAPTLQVTKIESLSGGLSNETHLLTVSYARNGAHETGEYVVRWEPTHGLLEPYDVARQYRIMRALETTKVPVPKMHWLEEEDSILGAKFFIMGKIDAQAEPRVFVDADPLVRKRKRRAWTEMLANIHAVDWEKKGLAFMGVPDPPESYAQREIEKWEGSLRRVQRGEEPLIDAAFIWLRAHAPKSKEVRLVHGDCTHSNYMFRDERIVAVLDWELATLGDPLADIGWWCSHLGLYAPKAEVSALRQEFLEWYQELTGRSFEELVFWELFSVAPTAVILVSGERFIENFRQKLREQGHLYMETLRTMLVRHSGCA